MRKMIALIGCLATVSWLQGISAQAEPPREAAAAPEAMVRQALTAVAANQPEQLYDLLPGAYQRDIEQLVVGFASYVDSALWDQGRAILTKLSRVLVGQHDLLSTVFAKQMPPTQNAQSVRDGIAALGTLLSYLANSNFSNLERLKQGDLRELLATDGHALMSMLETVSMAAPDSDDHKNMWSMMRGATVERVSLENDKATVRILSGDETEELQLVRVDDRWIPAEMAAEWQTSIDEMKQSIAAMNPANPESQQRRMVASMTMGMIDNFLTQIEGAKTEQDIDNIIGGMMMMMMGGGMMGR